jgi:hypothetical protein
MKGIFAVPIAGAIGVTVDGQSIFPAFNNMGGFGQEECEVGACFEHVGMGGGQPHIHGDPFGPTCLYSAANYTTTLVHPPQIGWSMDGASIYGRYLSDSAPGGSVTLDDCGGHTHDSYGYHYHTQVVSTNSTNAFPNHPTGVNYALFTPGVFKCWKGDITTISNFWATDKSLEKTLTQPCAGMTNYYSLYNTTTTTASSTSTSTTTSSSSSSSTTSTKKS